MQAKQAEKSPFFIGHRKSGTLEKEFCMGHWREQIL
jgi:hypothetical protein